MNEIIGKCEIDYLKFIEENDRISDEKLRADFISLLKENNLKQRGLLWENFQINVNSINQLPELANPFFLGFGNLNSKILFIGKEKGFDIYHNSKSFLNESINNILQWKFITQNISIDKELFNPRNPRILYNGKIKTRHTWGKYAQIVSKIDDINIDSFLNEYKSEEQSFLNHCFLTEINHIPSRYSIGHKLLQERKSLLKDPFYKRFKNVVIGAKGYLENSEIEEIFDVSYKRVEELGRKGRNKDKVIEATIFSSDKQQVIYCQQLSGASGWTNEAIDKLASILKE